MKFLKDDKREQRRIEKILKNAQRHSHVAVGILQEEQREDGFSMVDLAMVHEYGSKDGHIPQRSFIRSTCDAKSKDHIRLLKELEKRVFKGRLSKKQALAQFGEVASKDMVQSINAGVDPKLKTTTTKRKKSSKALIDTGRLKGSITHEVREGR